PVALDDSVGDVPFVRDAVNDAAAEPEYLRGRPVGTVGTDDVVDRRGYGVDRRPLSHLDTTLACRVEEKRIEAAAPRPPADGRLRAADDRVSEAEPKLDEIDLLLDDRRRIDGAMRERARRDAAAARLVARERRPVDQDEAGARGVEPDRRRRPRGPAADHEDVVFPHRPEATIRAPRG